LLLFGQKLKAKPQPQVQPPPAVEATQPPLQGRSAREAAYEKDISALEELLDRQTTEEAVRTQAGEQLVRMVENHQTELAIEEALLSAGFSPCLVVVQGDAITVTLDGAELSGTDGVTILSLCVAHSDVAVENIRIMTVEP